MSKNNNKKSGKFINFIIVLFTIISLIASGFTIYGILLYDSVENLLRYIIVSILGILNLIILLKCRKHVKGKYKKNKKPKKWLFILWLLIYSVLCSFIAVTTLKIYAGFDNINKETITYTSNLLVMSSNEAEDIKDIKDMTIGILKDKKSPEGYIIPKEIIKENLLEDENEIKSYDDYTSMLVDMYSNEIDAMFVGDYSTMFSGIGGYENIDTDTRVIISKSKEMKKADTSAIETASSGKSITEPFTILLMGIDSTDDVLTKNAIANGDTLILITFNPKTLNATMLSIPRDSYVPISCWSGKPENKITHAAAYGNDCMINTIQEYFDVDINYYAKINFKGLVKLVDAVGGVDIDVQQKLCTDNSNREKEVCINPGYQTLNGEEALVYARNRKALVNGDFGRGQHQQEIIMALINKMKTVKSVNKFSDIFKTVENNLDTNLTTKQIISFYNIGKDIIKKSLSSDEAELINIQQLYLQGTGQMIYDERAKMVLWDYIPNKNSRKDIIQAMKENLELVEHKDITEFSFSINKPYEKTVIGEGPYKTGGDYKLVPDFTGLTESQARALASRYGISVSFKGTKGTVVSQSYPANKRTDLVKGSIVLTLSNSGTLKDEDDDEDDEKTTNNKETNSKDKKDVLNDEDDPTSTGGNSETPSGGSGNNDIPSGGGNTENPGGDSPGENNNDSNPPTE